jgi:hypothetical protein
MMWARALLLGGLATLPAHANDGPFGNATRVSDEELAEERGGFVLPNGVDVALAAQIDTARNGELILRSVFRVEGSTQSMTVYAPAPGTTGPAVQGGAGVPKAGAPAPLLVVGGDTGMARVEPGPALAAVSINVQTGPRPNLGEAPKGLDPLPLTAGGPGIETAAGLVSLAALPTGMRVTIDGHMLDVHHLFGQAFGPAVANTASDQVIESATLVNIQLGNADALRVVAGTARAQGIALDAVRGLVR